MKNMYQNDRLVQFPQFTTGGSIGDLAPEVNDDLSTRNLFKVYEVSVDWRAEFKWSRKADKKKVKFRSCKPAKTRPYRLSPTDRDPTS